MQNPTKTFFFIHDPAQSQKGRHAFLANRRCKFLCDPSISHTEFERQVKRFKTFDAAEEFKSRKLQHCSVGMVTHQPRF